MSWQTSVFARSCKTAVTFEPIIHLNIPQDLEFLKPKPFIFFGLAAALTQLRKGGTLS